MDLIIKCIVVILSAGLVSQQVLELFDSAIGWPVYKRHKKPILRVASVALGYAMVTITPLDFVGILTNTGLGSFWRRLFTSLLISASTEASNSVMKFLIYTKESRKAAAAQAFSAAGTLNLDDIERK